jgi:hypothetical protein
MRTVAGALWSRSAGKGTHRARMARRGLATTLAMGAMATSVAVGGSVAQAAGKAPGCGLVPASVVDGVYGASVTGPQAQTKGPVTVCVYTSSAPVVYVLVRFEVNETVAMFKAGRKNFNTHKEPTVTVSGLGQMAYSSVLGSGKTLTSTVVVLTGHTELLVTGTGSLVRALSLTKKVLAKL